MSKHTTLSMSRLQNSVRSVTITRWAAVEVRMCPDESECVKEELGSEAPDQ